MFMTPTEPSDEEAEEEPRVTDLPTGDALRALFPPEVVEEVERGVRPPEPLEDLPEDEV
jgi:hypothetical protein